jgi:predicted RNA-binding Zn-ribbon protein involved in translation (DUF1610 family)
MPRTINCIECGIVLNVPDQAMGKRLKCPKCGTRFALTAGAEGSPNSTCLLATAKNPSPRSESDARNSSAECLPTAPGDLRDTFDLPMLDDARPGSGSGSGLVAAGVPASSSQKNADALALFDDGPKAKRRPTGAEARSKARRCTTCGGVVPAGMSICGKCGLDLESGSRVSLDDDLGPPPPPPAPAMPIPIGVIGGVSFLASLIFAIATLSLWLRGTDGYQYFVPVCLFGIFAAVQFLRRKSSKLLLMALTFGLAIDIVALIAMPIYHANAEAGPVVRSTPLIDPDQADIVIPSVVERLDTQSLSLGIGLIVVYAAVSVYLISPPVKRYFRQV